MHLLSRLRTGRGIKWCRPSPSSSGSHEPAEDDPERPGQARPQQPQRRPGRQQPAETAADGEGASEAQAAGAAPTEAAGQTSHGFTDRRKKKKKKEYPEARWFSIVSHRSGASLMGPFFLLARRRRRHRCNLDLVSHARQTLSLPNADTSRRAAPPGPRVYSGLRHNTTG